MKRSQAGFFLVETVVVLGVIVLIVAGASTVTYRAIRDSRRTDEHLTAVRNLENAGYWITRDTQMADKVLTDNLTAPTWFVVKWTEWGYDQDSVYHSATYSIENISGNIGQLKRTHQDSEGASEQNLVAEYVYYNLADSDNTTRVTHQNQVLDVRVATRFGNSRETKDYRIYCRPNFMN